MESWRRHPWLFAGLLLPGLVWLVAFFLAPLFLVWLMSFGEKRGIVDIELTWTLANYARAFAPVYLKILAKTVWISLLVTAITIVVAWPVALAIAFSSPRVRPWLLLAVILPFWINMLIRTYALIAVFRTRGYVNFTLEWIWNTLGLDLLFGRYEPLQLLYNDFAVIFGIVYVFLPFAVLPLYAAIERLDRSLIEASLDLGASQLRTFVSVVLPLTMPGIVSAVILVFIPALGSFLIPELLGGPNAYMIGNVIAAQFKKANDWPFGAALSFLLMYATFGILALRTLLAGRRRGGGGRGSSGREEAGAWA